MGKDCFILYDSNGFGDLFYDAISKIIVHTEQKIMINSFLLQLDCHQARTDDNSNIVVKHSLCLNPWVSLLLNKRKTIYLQ